MAGILSNMHLISIPDYSQVCGEGLNAKAQRRKAAEPQPKKGPFTFTITSTSTTTATSAVLKITRKYLYLVDLDADVAVVVDVDVIVNGVNSILTVESSRETKKFSSCRKHARLRSHLLQRGDFHAFRHTTPVHSRR
ncbi:MAG TPA: hypothetical protein VGL91_22615 [Acidobacteriota bacterium]|jgi:hypothetical protein